MFKKLNRLWYAGVQKIVKRQRKRVLAALKEAKPARRKAVSKPSSPRQRQAPGLWQGGHYAPAGLGRPMHYRLFLPPLPAAGAVGMPMVVMLHGCQQDASEFAAGTGMNRLAAHKGYAVLYPEQSAMAHPRRCWKWYDAATQRGEGDIAVIAALVQEIAATHAIDRSRIYACGISAGAGMANILALNHPELIAAVGLHSGPAYGGGHGTAGALAVMQRGAGLQGAAAIRQLLRQRPGFPIMPTILIQGEGDKIVRPVNQAQLVQQSLLLNRLPAGTEVTVVERARRGHTRNAHEIRDYSAKGKVLLRVARIADLEHAWSGGDPALSFNAKAGPDASKMMLDFFAKHRRVIA